MGFGNWFVLDLKILGFWGLGWVLGFWVSGFGVEFWVFGGSKKRSTLRVLGGIHPTLPDSLNIRWRAFSQRKAKEKEEKKKRKEENKEAVAYQASCACVSRVTQSV